MVDNFGLADDDGSYVCQASDGTRSTNSSTLSFTGMYIGVMVLSSLYYYTCISLHTAFDSGINTLTVVTDPVANEITFENVIPLDNRTAVPLGSTINPVGTEDRDKLLRCVSGHVGDQDSGGFKPPSVVWVRNGEQVVPSSRHTIIDSTVFSDQRMQSEVQISNFSLSDAGVYQCIFTDADSDTEVITTTPLRLDTGWSNCIESSCFESFCCGAGRINYR